MAFSSIEFLWLFMPLALGLYLALPPRARNALLASLSLVFYIWGAHALLFMFLASIGINYAAGLAIARTRARWILWAAVAANVAFLAFWKYADFAVEQVSGLHPGIALPLGISFFTFHGISYVVDVWRGTARPMRRLADYAQYMAFFPQLISGPIVRYHEIDEQIRQPPPRSQRFDDIADGFPRFALGLSKKVVVADPLGGVVAAVFDGGGTPGFGMTWVGAIAFAMQIYFDFSGYSDMAIGLARMFGLRFPENFKRPYSAVSLTDFWRRWHMTLSRWFRDYLYIPLGGSRGTQSQTVLNLFVVFFLTGIWHGAAWTFVLWGVYHGTLLVGERLFGIAALPDDRAAVPRRAVTFLAVVVGWVLFRANSVGDAFDFYRAMVPHPGVVLSLPLEVSQAFTPQAKVALAVGLATLLFPRGLVIGRMLQDRWSGAPLVGRAIAIAALPYATIVIAAGSFSPFLYFRF
ncbi:MAG: alginate O-acetyltransferase complex protein AlgI [Thermoleophilaceae bacterium]|jgi:alginate O-acetyltransferase complex protein AlgI|nr:alginate O-acetyltransferase complex protein AlgI [Thermoleophilaceae bacterium]